MHDDYEKIRLAIQYLEEHIVTQPSLSEVAGAIGLSPHQFQRLFQRWSGVSPRLFLCQLRLQRAKRELAETQPLNDSKWSTNLSSGDRLNDPFVTLLAVPRNEYRLEKKNLQIDYGFHPTRFGRCLAATTTQGFCWLSFTDENDASALEHLQREWPAASLHLNPVATGGTVRSIAPFPDRYQGRRFPLHVRGTNFQIRIWKALLQIPEGTTVTYGNIAEIIGQPNAARAVGNAVGSNPVAYLIPCHRVIRENGAIGGYRWSSERKRLMLAWERVRQNSRQEAP